MLPFVQIWVSNDMRNWKGGCFCFAIFFLEKEGAGGGVGV